MSGQSGGRRKGGGSGREWRGRGGHGGGGASYSGKKSKPEGSKQVASTSFNFGNPSGISMKRTEVDQEGQSDEDFDWDMDFVPEDDDVMMLGAVDEMPGVMALEDASTQSVTFEQWEREVVDGASVTPSKSSLIFQQLEVDYYIASKPVPGVAKSEGTLTKRFQAVPVLRMFGVTETGSSVCCRVHGFLPYIYASLPFQFKPSHCILLMTSLNKSLKKDSICVRHGITQPVLKITIVNKFSIMGYAGDKKGEFAKITLALPKLTSAVMKILESGSINIPDLGKCVFSAFEANVDFETRFMVDANIVGCNWIELPIAMYTVRSNNSISTQDPMTNAEVAMSRCQIEADVSYDRIISHAPEGVWSKVAPFRIMSFDIECAGRKGIFPEPDKDPVIQIANMVIRQGETEPFIRTIFTLKTCAPIIDAQVLSYSDEREMLEAWSDFVRKVDPDLLTGYNVRDFDLFYLLSRANHLKTLTFPYLGRIRNMKSIVRTVVSQSKQMGRRENKLINIDGRVIFDLFLIMQKDYKLRSYSLNAVSFHFLGEQKEDVHYSDISKLQNGDEQSRKRLAVYCLKDAMLPLKLMNKLMCVINYMEMARVTGVPLQYLLTRGQQVKVISQILRKAKERDYIMPTYEHQQGKVNEQFEGATVIEPIRGYYDVPIATLDFASLYPSIMMAHNLCYTTVLRSWQLEDLEPDTCIKTPSNNYFVKPSVRKGILPEILQDLLAARKSAKADLKIEKDPFKRQVLDGRQLALKISANSVYGFTGAQVGRLPCLAISQSVTAYGREMIAHTKSIVEQMFCTEMGYQHDAKVIYGDTDSVMVKFGVLTVAEAMKLGNEAATIITKSFESSVIKLEFEKVYFPYLLINKKRYAGLHFTKPEIHDKMDCKGLETIRRDNCPLVPSVLNKCLEHLMLKRDPKGAIAYAKSVIAELFSQKIDLSQLVITKELTKKAEEYKAKQAHVELAIKMTARDPGKAPKLGDRIPYVVIAADKKTPIYAKAEDPLYVLKNNIPIDVHYYLENQLCKPLVRILEPILGDKTKSELMSGDHTRTRVLVTSKVGPLSGIAIILPTCVGCKTLLRGQINNPGAICNQCLPNQTEIYLKELSTQSELEIKYNRLWSQCQQCQGSLHDEVLCTSRDCPIFYMRTKTMMDVEEQDKVLQRFK